MVRVHINNSPLTTKELGYLLKRFLTIFKLCLKGAEFINSYMEADPFLLRIVGKLKKWEDEEE